MTYGKLFNLQEVDEREIGDFGSRKYMGFYFQKQIKDPSSILGLLGGSLVKGVGAALFGKLGLTLLTQEMTAAWT